MSKEDDIKYLQLAIELAREGMQRGAGGPFGAVVVKDSQIVGRGPNRVTSTNDPTAHAEIVAIRDACKNLNDFQLHGCTLYSSCEPCPMCLGAIYWARPERLVFACSADDAAEVGFDDQFIYNELKKDRSDRKIKTEQKLREEGRRMMKEWEALEKRTDY